MKKYILGAAFLLVALVTPLAPAQAAGLSQTQINSIVALLSSFFADQNTGVISSANQATINSVQTALGGTAPTTNGSQAFCHDFYDNLTFGATDKGSGDISALNRALMLSGIEPSGNTFDDGHAAGVVIFQRNNGIRQTGYVGPTTRAKLNALYGCQSVQTNQTNQNGQTMNVTGQAPVIYNVNGKGEFGTSDSNQIIGQRLGGVTLVYLMNGSSGSKTVLSYSVIDDTRLNVVVPNVPGDNYTLYVNSSGGTTSAYVGHLGAQTTNTTTTTSSTVPTTGTLSFSKSSFSATYVQGKSLPSTLSDSPNLYTNTGYSQSTEFKNTSNVIVNYTISVPNQPAWLNSSYATGQLTANPGQTTSIGGFLDPTAVATTVGTYTTSIIVSGNFKGSPVTIPVMLTVIAPTTTAVTVAAPTITSATISRTEVYQDETYTLSWSGSTGTAQFVFKIDSGNPSMTSALTSGAISASSLSAGTHYVDIAACNSNTPPSCGSYTRVSILVKARPTVGTYVGYLNGTQFISTSNTQADALANCMTNHNNNLTLPIRCTWNGSEIYSFTPSTSSTGTGTTNTSTGLTATASVSPASAATSGIYQDETYTLSWSGSTGTAQFVFKIDSGNPSMTSALTSGAISASSLSAGTHYVDIAACNSNTPPSCGSYTRVSILVKARPTITISTSGTTLYWSSSSNASSCKFNVNNGAWTNTSSLNGNMSLAGIGLTVGTSYVINAYCIDSSGQQGPTATLTYTPTVAMSSSGDSSQMASAFNAFSSAANAGVVSNTNDFRYTLNRDLQIGSPYVADVTALQTALTKEGVYAGEVTGGFYNQTFAAVKAFQQKYGIETTGFVGSQTRSKLNSLYSN